MIVTGHEPKRPEWDCEPCETPWPCDTARVGLRELYANDPEGLVAHMRLLEPYAAEELRLGPQEFFERFVEWTLA